MAIKFYKKEYIIAVYDTEDTLVGVCDNIKEFARIYHRSYDVAASIIGRINRGERKTFYHGDKQLKLFLIPLDPEEVIELQKEQKDEGTIEIIKDHGPR